MIADLPVEYVEPHDLRKAVEKGGKILVMVSWFVGLDPIL